MKFCTGDEVEHELFGKGVIESLSPGRVAVDFATGEKTLALSMVRFERVWRGSLELGPYDGSQQGNGVAESVAADSRPTPSQEWRPPIPPLRAHSLTRSEGVATVSNEPSAAAAVATKRLTSESEAQAAPKAGRTRVALDFAAIQRDLATKSIREVAETLGITEVALRSRLHRVGIKVGHREQVDRAAYQKAHVGEQNPEAQSQKGEVMPKGNRISSEMAEQCVQLYANGASADEIAAKFKLSKSGVLYQLKKSGVPIRSRWEKTGTRDAKPDSGSALRTSLSVNGNGHAKARFVLIEFEGADAVIQAIAALNKALETRL